MAAGFFTLNGWNTLFAMKLATACFCPIGSSRKMRADLGLAGLKDVIRQQFFRAGNAAVTRFNPLRFSLMKKNSNVVDVGAR